MKKIKKEILDAILFYKNENKDNLSVTAVAKLHNIDKQTLFIYIESTLDLERLVSYKGDYYLLSDKDTEALSEYLSNESINFLQIRKKFGFKQETFKKLLEISGCSSERRYRNPIDESRFAKIETEEDAYFLGFFLADGYVNTSRGTARVKVSDVDSDILDKLSKYMGLDSSFIKDEYHKETGNKQRYLSIYRKAVVDNLADKGVHQAKSNKEIPYYNIKPSLVRHYIRGIFDGDGYIWKGGWSVGFSISKEVLLFIKNVFDSQLPTGYSNCKKGVHFDGDSNVHRLRITGQNNVMAVLNYLYGDATVYLDRKYSIYQDYIINCRE